MCEECSGQDLVDFMLGKWMQPADLVTYTYQDVISINTSMITSESSASCSNSNSVYMKHTRSTVLLSECRKYMSDDLFNDFNKCHQSDNKSIATTMQCRNNNANPFVVMCKLKAVDLLSNESSGQVLNKETKRLTKDKVWSGLTIDLTGESSFTVENIKSGTKCNTITESKTIANSIDHKNKIGKADHKNKIGKANNVETHSKFLITSSLGRELNVNNAMHSRRSARIHNKSNRIKFDATSTTKSEDLNVDRTVSKLRKENVSAQVTRRSPRIVMNKLYSEKKYLNKSRSRNSLNSIEFVVPIKITKTGLSVVDRSPNEHNIVTISDNSNLSSENNLQSKKSKRRVYNDTGLLSADKLLLKSTDKSCESRSVRKRAHSSAASGSPSSNSEENINSCDEVIDCTTQKTRYGRCVKQVKLLSYDATPASIKSNRTGVRKLLNERQQQQETKQKLIENEQKHQETKKPKLLRHQENRKDTEKVVREQKQKQQKEKLVGEQKQKQQGEKLVGEQKQKQQEEKLVGEQKQKQQEEKLVGEQKQKQQEEKLVGEQKQKQQEEKLVGEQKQKQQEEKLELEKEKQEGKKGLMNVRSEEIKQNVQIGLRKKRGHSALDLDETYYPYKKPEDKKTYTKVNKSKNNEVKRKQNNDGKENKQDSKENKVYEKPKQPSKKKSQPLITQVTAKRGTLSYLKQRQQVQKHLLLQQQEELEEDGFFASQANEATTEQFFAPAKFKVNEAYLQSFLSSNSSMNSSCGSLSNSWTTTPQYRSADGRRITTDETVNTSAASSVTNGNLVTPRTSLLTKFGAFDVTAEGHEADAAAAAAMIATPPLLSPSVATLIMFHNKMKKTRAKGHGGLAARQALNSTSTPAKQAADTSLGTQSGPSTLVASGSSSQSHGTKRRFSANLDESASDTASNEPNLSIEYDFSPIVKNGKKYRRFKLPSRLLYEEEQDEEDQDQDQDSYFAGADIN